MVSRASDSAAESCADFYYALPCINTTAATISLNTTVVDDDDEKDEEDDDDRSDQGGEDTESEGTTTEEAIGSHHPCERGAGDGLLHHPTLPDYNHGPAVFNDGGLDNETSTGPCGIDALVLPVDLRDRNDT